MPRLPTDQIDHIKAILDAHGELPPEWRWVLFPPEKQEYELVYAGKQREQDILANTMAVPLQPARTFGDTQAPWLNRLIFGDNLQAMQYLRGDPDVYQRVKLIYIDPPFATKQDFRGSEDQKAYQDKVAGAEFIEFIRERAVLLRSLLAPEGSLFVHVDYRKVHYLKAVLDELFGEENFRNEIILPGRASKNLQQQFDVVSRLNVRHDTLLWYSASSRTRFSPLWVDKHKKGNPEGHWHHFWSNADRKTMRYPLFGITPKTGQWTWESKRAYEAVANYERYRQEGGGRSLAEYWRDTGSALDFIRQSPDSGQPQYWRPPAEMRLADTVWAGVPVYSNGTKYPTEKNEALLRNIIELASDRGDLVLDAFAGSGTTLAVAEKLGRQWIGIDSGKLAIYTIQKRLLHLRAGIGNKSGAKLQPQPFTLYNAGLYDFASLRELPWEGWRFFALRLFECKDRPHSIGTFPVDGERRGEPVLVFNWKAHPNATVSEETIDDIHAAIGQKLGRRFYIIAPMQAFEFMQDYIVRDDVRYYALRIPYNFIQELHQRDFQAVLQARNATAVNDIQEAYGFSFIVPPEVEFTPGLERGAAEEVAPSGIAEVASVDGFVAEEDEDDEEDTASLEAEEDDSSDGNGHRVEQAGLFPVATIATKEFVSKSRVKGTERDGGKETLAMLLVDTDYDGQVFQMTEAFFGHQLEAAGWVARLNADRIGKQVMAIWVDYHGNEFKAVIPRESFGLETLLADETSDAPAIAPIGELSGS